MLHSNYLLTDLLWHLPIKIFILLNLASTLQGLPTANDFNQRPLDLLIRRQIALTDEQLGKHVQIGEIFPWSLLGQDDCQFSFADVIGRLCSFVVHNISWERQSKESWLSGAKVVRCLVGMVYWVVYNQLK